MIESTISRNNSFISGISSGIYVSHICSVAPLLYYRKRATMNRAVKPFYYCETVPLTIFLVVCSWSSISMWHELSACYYYYYYYLLLYNSFTLQPIASTTTSPPTCRALTSFPFPWWRLKLDLQVFCKFCSTDYPTTGDCWWILEWGERGIQINEA